MKQPQSVLLCALVVAPLLLSLPESSQAFSTGGASFGRTTKASKTAIFDGNGTGGWGIGGQREITPQEYAKGDRRYFDGYKMSDQGDFMKKIEADKAQLEQDAMDELRGIANFAGLTFKGPKSKMNKFDDAFLDDDDDLDLSV